MNMRFVSHRSMRKQDGFTIVELLTVIAVITILAIVSIFAVPPLIISGKVGPSATELTRGMQKMRINSEGSGLAPYAAVTTSTLANQMRGGSVFTVTGSGTTATLQHSLKLLGAGDVTVAPATLLTAGDAYAITVNTSSDAACPGLAASVQRSAEVITINGVSVKAAGGKYNGAAASDACTLLDTNTFVFTAS